MRKTVSLSPEDRAAWAMLQRARPLVEWHKGSLRAADFTGEGKPSRVLVGSDGDGGWVGLVRPGREGPQNPGVFQVPSNISLTFQRIESTDGWVMDGAFVLAGCRPRKGMHLLNVRDAESGGVQLIYWAAEARGFHVWSPPRHTLSGG